MNADGSVGQFLIQNGVPIFQNLLSDFISVVIAILVVQRLQMWWCKRKYGGWRVLVWCRNEKLIDRPVSHEKAKQVLTEEAELSVFLKGVASPFGPLKCDLVSTGTELGLLKVDNDKREFVIRLENNPAEYTTCRPLVDDGDQPDEPASESIPAIVPSY